VRRLGDTNIRSRLRGFTYATKRTVKVFIAAVVESSVVLFQNARTSTNTEWIRSVGVTKVLAASPTSFANASRRSFHGLGVILAIEVVLACINT